MKNKLNNIPNVEVIDIWGHKDITLEEITARLRVCDTNEIVMANLSKDVFNYPEDVFINEINGYSFIVYQADCGYFNLGTKSPLHKDFGLTFYSPEDVIQNIDSIYNFVKSLKIYPEKIFQIKYMKVSLNSKAVVGLDCFLEMLKLKWVH
jgi:hypothetical protein